MSLDTTTKETRLDGGEGHGFGKSWGRESDQDQNMSYKILKELIIHPKHTHTPHTHGAAT